MNTVTTIINTVIKIDMMTKTVIIGIVTEIYIVTNII